MVLWYKYIILCKTKKKNCERDNFAVVGKANVDVMFWSVTTGDCREPAFEAPARTAAGGEFL